jgi:uncharacterized protein YcaQ
VPDALAVSAPAARRFLVLRHFLVPPRGLPAEPESVLAVVDRLGSLQFDPLAVAGRNHDLVLHARIAGYRPAWTDDLLYRRRLLFEALNKGLSILPSRELPWYRHTWDRHAQVHEGGIFADHPDAVEAVLERIRAEGPLSSLDFEREPAIDWYWGPTSRVRAVLEALSEAGILGLARRDGNRRFYDLVERLYPPALLEQRVPEPEQVRHRLLSRFRGHGLLGGTGSAELWNATAPARAGTGRFPGHSREEMIAKLVDLGELTPVLIDGIRGRRYLVTNELGLLAQAEREVARGPAEARIGDAAPGFARRVPPGVPSDVVASPLPPDPFPAAGFPAPSAAVAFLAPLDPLTWDRDLLRSLFGFDYVWEVYVPAARRRWGYYVLPLLFGDRLVGRIEPRVDRTARRVRILGAWWEAGFDPLAEPGFVPALAAALEAYRRFAGAEAVTWPRTRDARALAGALRRHVA